MILAYLLAHPEGSPVEDIAAHMLEQLPHSPIRKNIHATVASLTMMLNAKEVERVEGSTQTVRGISVRTPDIWKAVKK